MQRLNFKVHQIVLTDALLKTVRQHVEAHGGRFREEDLEQMSTSIETVAAEALMFGGDCWPTNEEPSPSNDNVVTLRPADPMAGARSKAVGRFRLGLAMRVLLLRCKVGLWIRFASAFPAGIMLMREGWNWSCLCHFTDRMGAHGALALAKTAKVVAAFAV